MIDSIAMSEILASDTTISDYEIWSEIRTVENEIYTASRLGAPINIEMLYARKIMQMARNKRAARQNNSPRDR